MINPGESREKKKRNQRQRDRTSRNKCQDVNISPILLVIILNVNGWFTSIYGQNQSA